MDATRPNIFLGGLRLLLSNKRTLLWSYLALLAVGLIGGASMHARLAQFVDHSLAAQKLAGSIDFSYYGELFDQASEHDPGNMPVTAALTLLSMILAFFFAAGILHVFLASVKPRLGIILGAGVDYFWRFFRLALFAAVIAGLILGPLGWLRTVYLKHADDRYVEAAYVWRFMATLVVLLLIAVVLRLWFDLAEVFVVKLGHEGDRRVRRTLGPALRLLRAHFISLFGSYFVVGALGWLVSALFFSAWFLNQTSHLILPVFLWSQLGLLCLLASRIWQRGIVASLVLAVSEPTQTVIIVEPGPPQPYPLNPIFSNPEPGEDGSYPLPPAEPIGDPAV